MTFAIRSALGALATIVVAGSALPLQAQDNAACAAFEVYPDYLDVRLVDLGEPGMSIGDMRVGEVRLLDDTGAEVGRQHFHATVISGGGDGTHMLLGHGDEVYANGTITWSGSFTFADPSTQGPPADDVVVSVVGGTGDFAGANGTLTWSNDALGRRVASFDIRCVQ